MLYAVQRECNDPTLGIFTGTVTVSVHIKLSLPGQLSLLPSVLQEVSTSQSAVMLCGWRVKAGMVYSTCG